MRALGQKAVEGITPLLYEDSAVTDLKLNEAFTQLRRARAYCKAGWVAVAKQNYGVHCIALFRS